MTAKGDNDDKDENNAQVDNEDIESAMCER